MSNIWVILGVGNLIRDLQDAIYSKNDSLRCVVINQSINQELRKKILVPIVDIEDYRPSFRDQHIFGFLDPEKEEFLSRVSDFCHFGNLIHEKAYIAPDVKLGHGNYFGPMSVIAPGTVIGNFNYLNRCSSVGHDVIVGNFNHFGPSAVICGNTKIGDKNYFGANSTLIDGKSIKNNIFIGASGVVSKDLSDAGTYIGIPVKKI